jgi:acyl carrier protein
VLAPKVAGAWNLHTLTASLELDFFVLFSSVAAVLGSLGQGNYCAANAFLDALAHHRRARGCHALSIDWGPWSEVGLAARPDRGGRLAQLGVGSITPGEGIRILEALLGEELPQVTVVPIDWARLAEHDPGLAARPLVAELLAGGRAAGAARAASATRAAADRRALAVAAPEERAPRMEAYLAAQIARVLGIAPTRVDLDQPLNGLGLDSLTGSELKTRIEVDLGVVVSMVDVLQNPTIRELAVRLVGRLEAGTERPDGSATRAGDDGEMEEARL